MEFLDGGMGNSKCRDFLRKGSQRGLTEVFVRGTKGTGVEVPAQRDRGAQIAERYMVVCISVGSVRLGLGEAKATMYRKGLRILGRERILKGFRGVLLVGGR
jgi:hypothetical protein